MDSIWKHKAAIFTSSSRSHCVHCSLKPWTADRGTLVSKSQMISWRPYMDTWQQEFKSWGTSAPLTSWIIWHLILLAKEKMTRKTKMRIYMRKWWIMVWTEKNWKNWYQECGFLGCLGKKHVHGTLGWIQSVQGCTLWMFTERLPVQWELWILWIQGFHDLDGKVRDSVTTTFPHSMAPLGPLSAEYPPHPSSTSKRK